ncbi:MAG: inositol monophosphatase [Deltaproteobacteria bacterium]|nr:inositol monophosphatase [Deltaproteobacteria bacterium]
MKRADLEAVLVTARAAAREAGDLVQRAHRKRLVVEHKGAVDLVTQWDRASESLLRERLAPLGFAIVGEEEGGTWDRTAPAFFIDPIDGTTNFVHGHPFWCVSVGLVAPSGEALLGVVRAPSLGLEHYGLVDDAGGRLARRVSAEGDDDCAVSQLDRFQDSLLATGFPYDRQAAPENNFDAFVAIKKKCQAVRRCGSAALDLCLVADGTYDGYWERKLRPWDVAAGIAIVRGAGGRVTDFEGGDAARCLEGGRVVATNGRIHDVLLDELANVSPRSLPASK